MHGFCTVFARFQNVQRVQIVAKSDKGCRNSKFKICETSYKITLKRNFQKLRESPGVRYESVGRGFESLPSHQENPEHIVFWVFFFVF